MKADPESVDCGELCRAAKSAQARLVLARWLDLLGLSALPVFASATAVAAAGRVLGRCAFGPTAAVGLLILWLAVCAVWARVRRPTVGTALAMWDERAGRNEQYLSAYCFELQPGDMARGERLHVERARSRLRDDLANLRRDLPCPVQRRAWLLPAAFVGLVASGLFRGPTSAADERLDSQAAAEAREVGAALGEEARVLDPLEGLTPEERKEIEKLRAGIGDTAERLRRLSDETPREVLEELERRAREAEKLADAFGAGEGDILSTALVAELERHADTAELAGGLRAKDPGKIASEAEKIAERLRREPSIEERERLEDALSRAIRSANQDDLASPTGRSLAEANRQLKEKRLRESADEFSKIARRFKRAKEQRRARRRLQRLADRLRASGQRIFAGKGSVQRLAQQRYAAQPRPASGRIVRVGALPPGQRARFGSLGRMPIGSGRRQGTQGYCPVPGSGPQGAAQPGQGQIPVPGAGQAPIPGGGMGQTPVPGSGTGTGQLGEPSAASAGDGGHEAGHGSAPYGNTPTRPFDATSTGVVNAQAARDGESSVRRIDGGMHSEEAERESRRMAVEFINAEEEALDAEPLPLTRRTQILRYFTGLRTQIEGEAAPTGTGTEGER
jgi:hypothetical protein